MALLNSRSEKAVTSPLLASREIGYNYLVDRVEVLCGVADGLGGVREVTTSSQDNLCIFFKYVKSFIEFASSKTLMGHSPISPGLIAYTTPTRNIHTLEMR